MTRGLEPLSNFALTTGAPSAINVQMSEPSGWGSRAVCRSHRFMSPQDMASPSGLTPTPSGGRRHSTTHTPDSAAAR